MYVLKRSKDGSNVILFANSFFYRFIMTTFPRLHINIHRCNRTQPKSLIFIFTFVLLHFCHIRTFIFYYLFRSFYFERRKKATGFFVRRFCEAKIAFKFLFVVRGWQQTNFIFMEIRVQFHQRFMCSFCANSLAPIKYKPKTWQQKSSGRNLRK